MSQKSYQESQDFELFDLSQTPPMGNKKLSVFTYSEKADSPKKKEKGNKREFDTKDNKSPVRGKKRPRKLAFENDSPTKKKVNIF